MQTVILVPQWLVNLLFLAYVAYIITSAINQYQQYRLKKQKKELVKKMGEFYNPELGIPQKSEPNKSFKERMNEKVKESKRIKSNIKK